MPTLNFHRRHLRSTAAWTLFVWMLAMLAGLANACQLRSYVPAMLVPVAAAQADAGSHCRHGGQAPLAVEDPSDAAMAGCLKFCDEASSTVAKGGTAPPDLAGMVVLAVAAWQATPAAATASQWRSAEPPASRGPPLFLRFLRLTI